MQIDEYTLKVLPLSERLFRFAGSFLKDQEEAKDVVQEVLLKLWEKRDQLGKIEYPEAFTMRMVRNRCLDKLKGVKMVAMSGEAEARMQTWVSGVEIPLEREDTHALVNRVIGRLPEQQRTVIHLRDIEQLEFEEIAVITGMNVNAARVNLSRARKQVREELMKIWEYEERRGKNMAREVL